MTGYDPVAARAAYKSKCEQELRDLLEDLAELMDPNFGGETNPDRIAARLGYAKKASLARRLHNHGYHELARIFRRDYDPEYAARYRERNRDRVLEWERRAVRKYRYGPKAA